MDNTSTVGITVNLNTILDDALRHGPFSFMRSGIKKLLSTENLNRLYAEIQAAEGPGSFFDKLLQVLNIAYVITEQDRARIPRNGPLVVIGNHPFGAIEGIILYSILGSIRPDVKLMANLLLGIIPETKDVSIFVDPFDRATSARTNIKPLKETLQWLKSGGALGVFPAGEVAHFNVRTGTITDSPWSDTIARIIRKTRAPVIPFYFQGGNSILFHVLGLIHPLLRTMLLPRELLNKRNTQIQVRAGNLISAQRLSTFVSDEEMMNYLRVRTYLLKNRRTGEKQKNKITYIFKGLKGPIQSIAPQHNPAALVNELQSLPAEQIMIENGEYLVAHAQAQQIPELLYEIGRLREITFRDACEGTRKAIDLDRFDNYYAHLFIWSKKKQEVVGAYRIGRSDHIVSRFGKKGLYTATLFQYRYGLLDQLGPALELGRSFIRHEYQKNYSPLLLLWKGIGRFIVQNPQYKMLFGPVSITNEYHSISRKLLLAFLKINNYEPHIGRLVKPKNPLITMSVRTKHISFVSSMAMNIEEVADIISDIEAHQKGIPILLKQYLRLGGKIIGFNVDPRFSNVLDALLLVDLTQTDAALLERYMGSQGLKRFYAYHQCPATQARAVSHANAQSVNACA
jgi:putative hemolysin